MSLYKDKNADKIFEELQDVVTKEMLKSEEIGVIAGLSKALGIVIKFKEKYRVENNQYKEQQKKSYENAGRDY